MSHFTVSDLLRVAQERYPSAVLSARDISRVLYDSRIFRDVPVVSGRRMIPAEHIEVVFSELRRAGKLPAKGESHV